MTTLKAIVYYSLKGEQFIRTKTYSREFDGDAESFDKKEVGAQVERALKGELSWKLDDKPFEIKNVRFQIINEVW